MFPFAIFQLHGDLSRLSLPWTVKCWTDVLSGKNNSVELGFGVACSWVHTQFCVVSWLGQYEGLYMYFLAWESQHLAFQPIGLSIGLSIFATWPHHSGHILTLSEQVQHWVAHAIQDPWSSKRSSCRANRAMLVCTEWMPEKGRERWIMFVFLIGVCHYCLCSVSVY